MLSFLSSLTPAVQALLATIFTWGVTALGAAPVLLLRKTNKTVMDSLLGMAAGVMLASSFFSLLSPAAEMSDSLGIAPWLPMITGFLGGGILLYAGDFIFDRLLLRASKSNAQSSKKRTALLIFSITLHNIPEGMAVGVAFGSASLGLDGATVAAACLLALGIGLQNFPEGAAVALPLRAEGYRRGKAFFIGQLSGIVEPIAGVFGALLVLSARSLLPYLLSFAAGAMIYVVVGELIPESQTNKNKSLMAIFTLLGFSVMMLLDVALS